MKPCFDGADACSHNCPEGECRSAEEYTDMKLGRKKKKKPSDERREQLSDDEANAGMHEYEQDHDCGPECGLYEPPEDPNPAE